jgi:hypothetical protein
MDLIVLNLQSKSRLERAFIGATAERIVRLSPIPVLSIPVIWSIEDDKGTARKNRDRTEITTQEAKA